MKKLLVTVIGATAAIGAFAGYPLRFNAFEAGSTTLGALIETVGEYWSAAADATNNTYAIKGDVSVGNTTLPIVGDAPTKSLEVKTTFGKPLNVSLVAGGATTNINAGLYFDSLVKFTVCDSAPDTSSYDGAKIVLWLQEDEDNHVTNLWVRAGYLSSGAVVETNYLAGTEISDDFADKWHRVTIKSIADITTGYNVPGFAIWVDKNDGSGALSVACNDAKWAESFPYANALTEDAAYLNSYKALFPSMVQSGEYAQNLQTVGFDGTGEIADLVFTDVAPDYAKDYVASKVNVNGKEYTTFEEAVGAVNGITAAGDVPVTLLKDMTLSEALVFAPKTGVNVVFDFAGKVLTTAAGAPAITIESGSVMITNSTEAVGGIEGAGETKKAILVGEDATKLVITAGYFRGAVTSEALDDDAVVISGGSFLSNDVASWVVDGKALEENGSTGLYDVVDAEEDAGTAVLIAEHPWYTSTKAVVLAENLPGQTGNIVSAFHGQGEGEYLGLTYSTNPQQFDLFEVNGTETPTKVITLSSGDASLNMPGFRGVAISKTLGVAMTMAYYAASNMYVFPLTGGAATVVSKPSAYSFDAGAFSPDGKYFFSNALNGESSNQFYVKWSVAVDAETGALSLTKVGSIDAGGRARNLAYARIKGRDLVFAMIDKGKVAVLDMTGDTASAWSATDLITDLPAHSYGTLCVSGVNATNSVGEVVAPHLTVATSTNNGATKEDVLNVYALTVPASGAVTASLTKSFDEDALTAAGFGDISDANRYGNTVYVTEDEATIYFARPDNKLYAAQYDAWVAAGLGFDGEAYTIADEAQLKAFQAAANASTTAGKTFKLTADIALTEAWEGIGVKGGKDLVNGASTKNIPKYEAEAFCGTFDGQNHTISNFQMENSTDYGAFFNSVNGATISNLKISFKEGKLCANSSSTGGDTGATFVGVARGSTLQNLTALAGSVTTVSASKDMAGIVGYLMAGSTVDSCTNELNVASLKTSRKSGGIALITQDGSGTATIRNCKNSGTATAANGQFGGIVGYVGTSTTIADCENTATVRMATYMSGTLTMSGVNKGNATVASCNKAIDGLNFATVDGSVATFVADNALALNGEYKVMATNVTATFAFAEAGTIAFDTALFTPTFAITAAEGLKLTPATVGTVTTYTAAVAGINPVDNTPVPVEASSETEATNKVVVVVPEAVAAVVTADAYKANFDFTATSNGDGTFNVSIKDIKEEVKTAVATTAEAIVSGTEATGTVTVPAGLYYKVTTYETLGGKPTVAIEPVLSTGAASSSIAKPGDSQGFIKVEIATTAAELAD